MKSTFYMQLKLLVKKNRSFIVTTKQKSIVDTQRIRKKDAKHTNMENHQFIKTNRKRKEDGNYKTARKHLIRRH